MSETKNLMRKLLMSNHLYTCPRFSWNKSKFIGVRGSGSNPPTPSPLFKSHHLLLEKNLKKKNQGWTPFYTFKLVSPSYFAL